MIIVSTFKLCDYFSKITKSITTFYFKRMGSIKYGKLILTNDRIKNWLNKHVFFLKKAG